MFTITTDNQTHVQGHSFQGHPPNTHTCTHTHWDVLANDSSTGRACDRFVFLFCSLFSLSFHLPHLHTVRYLSPLLSLSLTFILPGCLQGCVRQALLSGLPPSSAPLSLELTVMNERGRKKDEGGGGRLSFCRKDEGGRYKRATNQSAREMLLQ